MPAIVPEAGHATGEDRSGFSTVSAGKP